MNLINHREVVSTLAAGCLSYSLLAKRGLPPDGLQASAALLDPGVGLVPAHL